MSAPTDRRPLDRMAVIRRLVEGNDAPDPELFAPDFKNNTPWEVAAQESTLPGEPPPGPQNVFSDAVRTIEEATETGDTIVVRWRLQGRWTGPLPFAPSILPTGKEVDFTGTEVYRFEGDKIVEKDGEFDVKTASKQLLAGLNITCGSLECVEVVQSLSRRVTLPEEGDREPTAQASPERG